MVTVEDLTREARLSRGAFYSHFRSLEALWAAVEAELASAIRDFSPAGVAEADPVARTAGCAAFIGEAQRTPCWGALFARGARAFPAVASAARDRLKATLGLAKSEGRLAPFSMEVGFDLIFGVVLEAMRSANEARLSPRDVPDVVSGILRALGVQADDVNRALRQLDDGMALERDVHSATRTN